MTTREVVLHTISEYALKYLLPDIGLFSLKKIFQKVDDSPALIIYNSEKPLQALKSL